MHQRKLANSTTALNILSVGRAAQEGSLLQKKLDKDSRLYRSSENILDNSFGSSPRFNDADDDDDDEDAVVDRRRRSRNNGEGDPHYDVIESLNLGNESDRTQQQQQQHPEVTSYASSGENHFASDRSRGGGGGDPLFHATPREIDSASSYDRQRRDLPAPPPSALPQELQHQNHHFVRNGSSRASSQRSSCASDEMVVPPSASGVPSSSMNNPLESARRNSSKIPFSLPEYHQMATSPSSQGSGGIAHQSPTTASGSPRNNNVQLGSPGSELVSLNQFLDECNNASKNSEEGDGENPESTRRRASSAATEGIANEFRQDVTKGLSYYR